MGGKIRAWKEMLVREYRRLQRKLTKGKPISGRSLSAKQRRGSGSRLRPHEKKRKFEI